MENIIQDYPWGSRKYLQDLCSRNDQGPLAELWMGVHPRGMSNILPGTNESGKETLAAFIEKQKETVLGTASFEQLPFLFKLLAAGEPLSIQAHPNKVQAEQGFFRENEDGIALDAFNRNYKDDNHKPEIICALTEYWAMKGFRSPDSIVDYFKDWCPEDVFSILFPPVLKENSSVLKSFFLSLMNLEEEQLKNVIAAALEWCAAEDDDACRWVIKLHEKYPGDPGVLSPLYLNTICLHPGEALYLPAGELHAYLEGFGVELMANSDNVLRGGLTQKHMDMAELEKTLLFESEPPVRLLPEEQEDGTGVYKTPSREFELVSVDSSSAQIILDKNYPVSILVVLEGALDITEGDTSLKLNPGESCFLTANGQARSLKGARCFIARIPR